MPSDACARIWMDELEALHEEETDAGDGGPGGLELSPLDGCALQSARGNGAGCMGQLNKNGCPGAADNPGQTEQNPDVMPGEAAGMNHSAAEEFDREFDALFQGMF